MLLPRMAYLPLATQAVREHFLPSAAALEDEMWFDYDGVPLKWCTSLPRAAARARRRMSSAHCASRNVPIGVLHDVLSHTDDSLWKLTGWPGSRVAAAAVSFDFPARGSVVHFRNFPQDKLLRCPNVETVRSAFMNTLKEVSRARVCGPRVAPAFAGELPGVWQQPCADESLKV
jgi:autophagy-related protein 5